MRPKKSPLHSVAKDYFAYMGRHLPQQCASDEFYFLPRAEAAIQHLNTLDDLDPEKLKDHVHYVKNCLGEIALEEKDDLEAETDRLFLRQSMKSFLREFEEAKVWQKDPTLYVKIPLFATARALLHGERHPDGSRADLLMILRRIPAFLSRASQNLEAPSEVSLEVASNMTRDATYFHEQDIPDFIAENITDDHELLVKNKEVLEAWAGYEKHLRCLTPGNGFAIGDEHLGDILSVCLSYPKSPEDILKIAQIAFRETKENLKTLTKTVENRGPKGHLKHNQVKPITSPDGIVELYRKQVEDLRRFFYTHDAIPFPAGEAVAVLQTPAYLQSLRATASYTAPLTGDTPGQGVFYVTPGREDLELIASHGPYLSAHETYPGHHLLDHLRIHHPNPIRRQIESPLFYEGWACYGEQLLDDLGYIENPRQQIIGLKRQLWRELRAQLDIKLQTGKISPGQAAKEIEALGYALPRAKRQVRRFCLTPGYQLCYFMGMHEILTLREQFSSRCGMKRFHDILLGGGEIPFNLVERKFKETSNGGS
jgi:hypothetical protein